MRRNVLCLCVRLEQTRRLLEIIPSLDRVVMGVRLGLVNAYAIAIRVFYIVFCLSYAFSEKLPKHLAPAEDVP